MKNVTDKSLVNRGFSRRNFLIGSMAVAAMGARSAFSAAPGSVIGKARMKVGVLSDIHVRNDATQQVFIKALEWYRDKGVDAVIVAGDMADHGLVRQLQLVADAWFKVFPENKAPDGRTVTQLFEYGNHCVANWKAKDYKDPNERAKNLVLADPKGCWERAFHEAYEPVFLKTVNGYQFVGAHWPGLSERAKWFDKHAKEIDPSKPFFYFQHPHPKNTCYDAWAWGHDDGTSTRLLSPFENAVALSGHSHYSLTDERSIWQGAFTSIGTSSLSYTSLDYNYRENATGNIFGVREARKREMPGLKTGDGKQGMLFTVCDDHIRIERHDFMWNQSLGDDWILPVGKSAAKPFTYAKRKPGRTAPQFPDGAVAKAEFVPIKVAAKGSDGKEVKPPPPKQVKVTFTSAETREKCRVFEYEVQAVAVADDVEIAVATRRVLASDFYMPQSKAGIDGSCVFAIADLPKKTAIRFDVTPIECFGKRGAPIHTHLFTIA